MGPADASLALRARVQADREWGLRRQRHGHDRFACLVPVLVLLLGGLPQQLSSVSSTEGRGDSGEVLRCAAPVPEFLRILRGGDSGKEWLGAHIDTKRGRARELKAPKYVPGPLEVVAVPTLQPLKHPLLAPPGPAGGREGGGDSRSEQAAASPMKQFEDVRNAAAAGSAFLARNSGQGTKRRRQDIPIASTAAPPRPSALDLIRAKILQLPCEDEASVSLNSNEV